MRVLEQTIAETREARNGRLMLIAAAWAAGATVVYVLLLWVLRRVGRAVTNRMLEVADSTAGHIKIGGSEFLQRERARRFVRRLLQIGFWAFVLLLTYEWFGYVLSPLSVHAPVGGAAQHVSRSHRSSTS